MMSIRQRRAHSPRTFSIPRSSGQDLETAFDFSALSGISSPSCYGSGALGLGDSVDVDQDSGLIAISVPGSIR